MLNTEVIGSTSPLGTVMVERLRAMGRPVTATYRSLELVPPSWHSDPGIDLRSLDLAQQYEPSRDLPGTIVWLAHINAGRSNAEEAEANLACLDRFLDRIDTSVTRKFAFVSSGGSVYGRAKTLPIAEGQERDPLSSYGRAKKALEDRVLKFGRQNDVGVAILRPGNIYGFERPDRECKGVIQAFLRASMDGKEFTLIHGGETVRDFVHADDVCHAIVRACDSERSQIVWNVATGIGTRTIDVLRDLVEISGREMPRVRKIENYPTDVLTNILSIDRIRAESDWAPKIDLAEGLRSMLAHWFDGGERAAQSFVTRLPAEPLYEPLARE